MNNRSNVRSRNPDCSVTKLQGATVSITLEEDLFCQEETQKQPGQAISQKLTEQVVKALTNAENIINISELCLNAKIIQMPFRIRQLGGLNNLMNLRELDVSNNEIERIENLGALKQLRVLRLNANRIRKIENISVLKSLEILEASHNFVEDIPALISLNKLLNSLNLSYNSIQKRELIFNLRPCAKLRELFLIGNPFTESAEYGIYVQSSLRQLKSLDGQIIAPNSAFKKGVSPNPGNRANEGRHVRNNKNSEVKYDDNCDLEGFEEHSARNYFGGIKCSSPSNGAAQVEYQRQSRAVTFEFQPPSKKPVQSMNLSALGLHKDIMSDEQFSGRYIQQISHRDGQFTSNPLSSRGNVSLDDMSVSEKFSRQNGRVNVPSVSSNQQKEIESPMENNYMAPPRDVFQQQRQVGSLQSYQSLKKVLESKEMQTEKELAATAKHQTVRLQKGQGNENRLLARSLKDERRRVSFMIDELSSALVQYKLETDENSKTYSSLIKEIDFLKEECLTLMKQINAWLEGHINEGESSEYDSDSTRLVLLNERSEMISRIKEFLCLLDSENEYQMNYFLLALKVRCEKAERELKKTLNDSSMAHDLIDSQEVRELENEEEIFEAMIKELSDNYMELEKISVRVIQIRENLNARILKGFTLEKKYFSTLIAKLAELQESEQLRMGLFSELNEKYCNIYDVIQRIQIHHYKGLQIDHQSEVESLDKFAHQKGTIDEISVQEWNAFTDLGRKEIVSSSAVRNQDQNRVLASQNLPHFTKARYQDSHVDQVINMPAMPSENQFKQIRTASLETDATAKSLDWKKAGSSQNTSRNMGVVLNESIHSQQVPDHLESDKFRGNVDEEQSEQMEEEQLSANWGSNNPDSNSYNEYYSGNPSNCRSEEFLPSTLKPQSKQKIGNLTENIVQKPQPLAQDGPITRKISEEKPDFSTFLKNIPVAESLQLQDQITSECKTCKLKDEEIASLSSRIEKTNADNYKLTSNLQELCQTLDEVRESFENALKEQTESYEIRLNQQNQQNQQNEQVVRHISRLLDESQSTSLKITELQSSLESIYKTFTRQISNSTEIQTELPWILKTQSMVIETLIAQRVSLEGQYQSSLQLHKELVEAGHSDRGSNPQKIDLIISDFFNSKPDQLLPTNSNKKKSAFSPATESHQGLIVPILKHETLDHTSNTKSTSPSHRISSNQQEPRKIMNASITEFSDKIEMEEGRLKAWPLNNRLTFQRPTSNTETSDETIPKTSNKNFELLDYKFSPKNRLPEETQSIKKTGGLTPPQQNNRAILNQIVSALPQPRASSLQRRLEEAEIEQKRRYQNVNRLSFADRQPFTPNTNFPTQVRDNTILDVTQKNNSKTLELSHSSNSVPSSNSRPSSSPEKLPLTLPTDKQPSFISFVNQNEQLSTSSPNLSKALFGTKSAEKENNKDIANDTANPFLLNEIPLSALNQENIFPAKLNSSTSVPVIFNRITGNIPGMLSNLNENIAQNVYQKTPKKPQTGLINLHMNVVHYRDFKGKNNQKKSKQLIQKKDSAQNLNTSTTSNKTKATPKKQLLIPQLSPQNLASFKPQNMLTGNNSGTNLFGSNRLNTSQTAQPTQEVHAPDQSQVFRKNSSYTTEYTREISVNLQSFLDHKRRMFDTPDVANYSDRFDLTSPYHPLYTHSVNDQSRHSAKLTHHQSGLTSRSISREATNRVNSPAEERKSSNSFQSLSQENRTNPKGKTKILGTILGSKNPRFDYH